MDANARLGPPATRRNVTTRAKFQLVFIVCGLTLDVVALILFANRPNIQDSDSLRRLDIALCLMYLGLICMFLTQFLNPLSRTVPQWVIPAGIALGLLMLALVFSVLALYTFAFPLEAELAATLMLIASGGIVAEMLLSLLVLAANIRDRRRLLAQG